jgi:uncharacterized membrane protein YczE
LLDHLRRYLAADSDDHESGGMTVVIVTAIGTVQVSLGSARRLGRTATAAERERLWSLMVKVVPPYEQFAARTKLELPVIVLEPLR